MQSSFRMVVFDAFKKSQFDLCGCKRLMCVCVWLCAVGVFVHFVSVC